jgi:translation initiation factor 4G
MGAAGDDDFERTEPWAPLVLTATARVWRRAAAAEEPKAEEPKAEEPKAEEPKAEEPKAEEPKAEEPKADEEGEEGEPPPEDHASFLVRMSKKRSTRDFIAWMGPSLRRAEASEAAEASAAAASAEDAQPSFKTLKLRAVLRLEALCKAEEPKAEEPKAEQASSSQA